jgi:hypothetical protein
MCEIGLWFGGWSHGTTGPRGFDSVVPHSIKGPWSVDSTPQGGVAARPVPCQSRSNPGFQQLDRHPPRELANRLDDNAGARQGVDLTGLLQGNTLPLAPGPRLRGGDHFLPDKESTLFRRLSCEKVAPSGQFEIRRSSSSLSSMTDGLSTLYQDLLSGSYDCVDRIVLNAYFRMGA